MDEIFEGDKPDKIERLARIEGQGNFWSVLAGVDAARDTTEDMAALSFARSQGAIPEILETYVAQTGVWRTPIMAMTFRALCEELRPRQKDKRWMMAAVSDAFLLLRYGECKPLQERAKSVCAYVEEYALIRKIAHGVMIGWLDKSIREWKKAMRDERGFGIDEAGYVTPRKRCHDEIVEEE